MGITKSRCDLVLFMGRASLRGEGDPNGEDDDAPLTGTGLLLLLLCPSAISARGGR